MTAGELVGTDADAVCEVGRRAGLDAVGVAAAERFDGTRVDLEDRRERGLHAGMQFTYRNPARSTDPSRILDGASALVVGAYGYRRSALPRPGDPAGSVAAYARDDHYAELRAGLMAIADHLIAAGHAARVVADDNALVDREAAHRAGLGWYGKNSNLLLPERGSWFVLGSVVTDAPLTASRAPIEDGCGPCRRCLDGCPTGAIIDPGVVDSRRCLAWLVQADGDFPVRFRSALGDRLYGCDDCQEVCPPNQVADRRGTRSPSSSAQTWVDLVDLLDSTDAELLERHGRWYIPRRDPRFLRRNALVVLGNVGVLSAAVQRVLGHYLASDDALLAEHAAWAHAEICRRTDERRS